MKAQAQASAKAAAPKKSIKKAGKGKKQAPTKAAPKAPAKGAPKTPTKANKEVCECGRDERDRDRAMVRRWLERSSGRAERVAEREKVLRSLEASYANAERREEARLALEKSRLPFEAALASESRLAPTAREELVRRMRSDSPEPVKGVRGKLWSHLVFLVLYGKATVRL